MGQTERHIERHTGVLLIRAWFEGDHENGLRARILTSLDITRPVAATALAATTEDVLAAVHSWLDALAAQSTPPPSASVDQDGVDGPVMPA
jgi:hypothetical protein